MRTSKSSVFLMELLIDILLFSILCGCSLLIFSKSNDLSNSSRKLQQATVLCSNIAALYQTGNGDFNAIQDIYPNSTLDGTTNIMTIYFDAEAQACTSEEHSYVITIIPLKEDQSKVEISFQSKDGNTLYSLPVYNYTPATLKDVGEVNGNE